MAPIFVGGVLNYLVTRSFGKGLSEEELEKRGRVGTLFAAGLITGEALMGIFIGFAIYFADSADVFALPDALQIHGVSGEWVGLAFLTAIGWWLYSAAKRKPA